MWSFYRIEQKNKGYLLVLILVFGAIFFTMVTAFTGFVITQKKVQTAKYNKERALGIAEAGLNYYKWYLAHNPGDTTNGTGLPGPYVLTYADPEGDDIGEYSLEIAPTTVCGTVQSIDITSTGHTYEATSTTRTIKARYSQPTVSEYAYIINSNVWAGSDRTIIGPYHSNGGIRMDGTNNSTVTSGQETWTCTSSFGCSPTQTVSGVFGAGANNNLWTYPAAPINFTGLTVDLATMQDRAQNGGGLFIGPSGDWGYRIHFNSNNTIDVYVVDTVYSYWGYSSDDGWQVEYNIISDDNFSATYTVPSGCPLIFVEDKVWLEGNVSGKISFAAADVDTIGVDPTIILNGDIVYTASTSGLMAIAEDNVLIGVDVPEDMILNGIYVAQNGHFGRNYYSTAYIPGIYSSKAKVDTLTMLGSIVSNGRVGTKWSCGGTYCSGFDTRYNSYDRALVNAPPPLTPNTSDDYQFIEWLEVE